MTTNTEPAATIEFVRWQQVLQEIPLGGNTIRDMIDRGEFPAPVTLGPRAVGFLRDEIEAWKQSRIAARGK